MELSFKLDEIDILIVWRDGYELVLRVVERREKVQHPLRGHLRHRRAPRRSTVRLSLHEHRRHANLEVARVNEATRDAVLLLQALRQRELAAVQK